MNEEGERDELPFGIGRLPLCLSFEVDRELSSLGSSGCDRRKSLESFQFSDLLNVKYAESYEGMDEVASKGSQGKDLAKQKEFAGKRKSIRDSRKNTLEGNESWASELTELSAGEYEKAHDISSKKCCLCVAF